MVVMGCKTYRGGLDRFLNPLVTRTSGTSTSILPPPRPRLRPSTSLNPPIAHKVVPDPAIAITRPDHPARNPLRLQ